MNCNEGEIDWFKIMRLSHVHEAKSFLIVLKDNL